MFTGVASPVWWGSDRTILARVLADRLYAELRQLRRAPLSGPPPWLWSPATRLDETGPDGIDSLDQLGLATATTELLTDGFADLELLPASSFEAWCDAVAQSVTQPPGRVTLRTSGTTGAQRCVTQTLSRLEDEAAIFAALIGPGRRRVLSALPTHHTYGFIHAVLLPRHLAPPGESPLEVIDLRSRAPAALATLVRAGDLVLGHPLFWTAAMSGMAGGRLPNDVIGVTSSAPCPDATARGLMAAGLQRLLQVYGSSETAGIGWRDDPTQPYTLLPGWYRAGAGTSDDGLCYRDEVAITAPDRLKWQADQFRVLGRRDGAVQVGGQNVIPAKVAAALSGHEAVARIAVRPMRPDEGDRLKAFVVAADPRLDPKKLEVELRRLAIACLAPAERPGTYAFGPEIPANQMGKHADWV